VRDGGGDTVTTCEIDLRVGGNFHTVFVTPDSSQCSCRGTYVEIEPPTRLANTWLVKDGRTRGPSRPVL